MLGTTKDREMLQREFGFDPFTPIIPPFHYSIIPRFFSAEPIGSDLAHRTRFSAMQQIRFYAANNLERSSQ
ncbi:MAG: hypothetical protein CVU64_10145 [Deltaproteobacteria bacterium HGW-Deltaproteobacteria-21]|jgi:hypothetical protein|nr:MAG: hypothetical protein CVU64_10145 [Deltaproteobacteria bacterium HGW-Deltaproteobacteria-21]PKN66536.1 MAG: hypothetical protein CVU57_06130 [Deltaproteobacteria bacterium HGW-Deltaproteobacteria-15]